MFQQVADYNRPQWPDAAHPQQFHLDIDAGPTWADVDAAEKTSRQTALMWAAAEGHAAAVEALLAARADLKARSRTGFTAAPSG